MAVSADFNAQFREAAALGNLQKLQEAAMFVSSLDEPDKHSGCTAVMMAASREQLPALRWLVDQGADWKRRSEKGRTALMQAVLWGARGCAKYLVELGADLKQRDNSGKTVIDMARERGYFDLVEMLELHTVDERMKELSHTAGVRLIQELAVKATKEKKLRSQQLILACRSGNVGAVLRIVSNLRAVDLHARDKHGCTAMDYANKRCDAKLLAILKDVEDTASARERQHAAASTTFADKTPNPTAYTRDTGFVHDVLIRKPNVVVRSEPRRNWDVPAHAKAHVFGADALFHENAVASASDGVIRMRGMSSNDQLFNFDAIPKPQHVLSVKALRRMDRRTEDQHAKILGTQAQADDAESVHSDAESVREATNFLLPSGHGRWLSGPAGKHVVRERAAAGKLPAASAARIDPRTPTDSAARYDTILQSPREDVNALRGSRKHALLSWMKQHEVGGYYARLADLGATTVDDLAHVDPYMLKRDHEIVAYRKIRSNALTRKEKAVVLKYGHPTPLRASSAATAVTSTSKPAAPAQPRTAFAIKDELSREHIVLNAARRAIFGLPKLMFDDEADDEVLEDSGSSDGRSR